MPDERIPKQIMKYKTRGCIGRARRNGSLPLHQPGLCNTVIFGEDSKYIKVPHYVIFAILLPVTLG
jgi:hypothetical protein